MPIVNVASGCTCYSMTSLPDTRTGTTVVDINEYSVYSEQINKYTTSDKSYVFVDGIT